MLKQRTEYDIEMLREMGYTNGVENTRHMDDRGRRATVHPSDFFPEDFLIMIDESHGTGQIRGTNMESARARRCWSTMTPFAICLDNRASAVVKSLKACPPDCLNVATPGDYEMEQTDTVIGDYSSGLVFWIQKGSAPYHGTNGRSLGEINARVNVENGPLSRL